LSDLRRLLVKTAEAMKESNGALANLKSLKQLRRVWRTSEESGEAQKSLEKLRRVWRSSEESGEAQKSLEKLRRVWRGPKEFGEALRSFKRIPRNSDESGGIL
jgi:hypothetical protein